MLEPLGAVESWTQKPKFEYIKNDLKDTKIVGQEPAPNLEENIIKTGLNCHIKKFKSKATINYLKSHQQFLLIQFSNSKIQLSLIRRLRERKRS